MTTLILPYSFAKQHHVFLARGMLYRTAQTPLHALLEAQRVAHGPCPLQLLDDTAFEAQLQLQYQHHSGSSVAIANTLDRQTDLLQLAATLPQIEDLVDQADDAPIIRLLNALIAEAIREQASDIHIEPYENRVRIRLRKDGVLQTVLEPKRELGPLLVSRIKIMARLDIAERRLPQDGRMSIQLAGRPVDIRVAIIPSGQGERVVLRLLDRQLQRLDLHRLGIPSTIEQAMQRLIARPHGIILVTGPTGSGKTTTLYAALQQINQQDRNIMTVEEPVEYDLDGISQTAVNTQTGMTFASGLRAILRQDPDVIMVGEIRDLETAKIAIQASLTGHLVFSTLHTNTATGAITRLQDMGVASYLLASGMLAVLSQRLVRQLCPTCKIAATGTAGCAPAGCSACDQSGYQGRLGLYELFEITDPIRQLIHDGGSQQELEQLAQQQHGSLCQDGMAKVVDGTTTYTEVLRVTEVD